MVRVAVGKVAGDLVQPVPMPPYARVVQEGKLTRLWVRASASLPLGWHLAGIMRREIASQWVPTGSETGEDEWVALALEADGKGSAVGTGTSPEQALAAIDRAGSTAAEPCSGCPIAQARAELIELRLSPSRPRSSLLTWRLEG